MGYQWTLPRSTGDTTGAAQKATLWHDDRLFAELVARRLDIPFHTVDLSDQYRRRVVDYMFSEYAKGRTPNPDVLCNREIKFDVFLKEALKLGADFVATGHYCRKAEETAPDGRTIYKLLAGSDPNKDQSYFLCQLSQEQLSRALFPVGHLLKPEVRRIAEQMKLATAKRKDSQGICFVGKVDLPVFLQQKLKAKTGNVHEIKADWPKYGQAVTRPANGEDAGMGADGTGATSDQKCHPACREIRRIRTRQNVRTRRQLRRQPPQSGPPLRRIPGLKTTRCYLHVHRARRQIKDGA